MQPKPRHATGRGHALRVASLPARAVDPHARTALVMPIRHEAIGAVFGGLQAIVESLAAQPEASLFDVYVLSDSSDPDVRVAELSAFAALRSAVARIVAWQARARVRQRGAAAPLRLGAGDAGIGADQP